MAKRPKEERMGEILQAAVDEFLERGYDAASMERIGVRAGLTKGGIYHHFRSKDQLLLMANKHFSGAMEQVIIPLVQATDIVQALREFIETYLLYWENHRKELYFFSLSMTKTMEVNALSEYQTRATDELIKLVTQVFARGEELGQLKKHDSRTQAIALLSALTGSLGYIYINAHLDAREVIPRFQTLFVDSLIPT